MEVRQPHGVSYWGEIIQYISRGFTLTVEGLIPEDFMSAKYYISLRPVLNCFRAIECSKRSLT
jgi:hypothetical protein